MPVGWNWKNSMSSMGTPARQATATPSPVKECALLVTWYIRPKPPVAKSTALAWKTCSCPSAIESATTPASRPSATSSSSTMYSLKYFTRWRMPCW